MFIGQNTQRCGEQKSTFMKSDACETFRFEATRAAEHKVAIGTHIDQLTARINAAEAQSLQSLIRKSVGKRLRFVQFAQQLIAVDVALEQGLGLVVGTLVSLQQATL